MPLELELTETDSRWILVQARLGPVGRHYSSRLLAHPPAPSRSADELTVSVHRDGRVDEVVRVPDDTARVQWQPPAAAMVDPASVTMRPIGWIERRCRMAYRVAVTWIEVPWRLKTGTGLTLRRAFFDLPGAYRIATRFEGYYPWSEYADWMDRFDTLTPDDIQRIESHIGSLAARPRFHVLIASDHAATESVDATLASLKAQLYRDFEFTLEDGKATPAPKPEDWIILMRAGDTLAPHALYWLACAIIENPGATVVYSDDDAVDAHGQRIDPRFKPDWSPAHLRSTHFIGSAAALRGSAVAAAAGISTDALRYGNYELLLRIGDTSDVKPVHVPAVLYHRGSGLPGTRDKGQGTRYGAWENPDWCMQKLKEHLERSESPADVVATLPGCWRVRYRLPEAPPLVSIIVPTRDAVRLLRQCVTSILAKTTYPRYELLVVDNQSVEDVTISFLKDISLDPRVRVLRYDQPFNYSAINNFAAREARGEILCLLNNDTEVISPDWLEEMAGQLLQKGVGAVGARLLYPDGRVQHAGVTVGPGGGADHVHGHIAREEAGYCNRAVIAQEFSAVTAACMLTWNCLYERLGGLNESDLTVAFNDVDYCLRLQEAGHRVVYTPHAELFHHESATRGREETWRKRRRAKREVRYLQERWAARLQHDPYYNPNFSYRQPDFSLGLAPRVSKPWSEK